MKTIVGCAVVLSSITGALAQDSLQSQPMQSVEKEYQQSIGRDTADQKEERFVVNGNNLPSKMVDVLTREEKYKGWKNSTIYFEKNTEQYLVNIQSANSTRTYRFDKDGNEIIDSTPVNPADRARK